jgi:exopolyphosphatase / guanosine-5'-triphosphate,3'-diphosphate pyrophosphatase
MSNAYEKLAAIDMGTNTFHLLVVKPDGAGGFDEVLRESHYVHLAESGIETIGEAACSRAMDALRHFKHILDLEKVSHCRVTATAAMRTASNGPALQQQIINELNLNPEIISGDEEARLISKGVLHAVPIPQKRFLIMDIGGGSVEFILGEGDLILYQQSYPIGVAVLRNRWTHSHPILPEEKDLIIQYINSLTLDLQKAIFEHKPEILIGASGTFDILADYCPSEQINLHSVRMKSNLLGAIFQDIYDADWDTLSKIHWIPEQRRKLVISAFCLIESVLNMGTFEYVYTSSYAIKEGVLLEMIEKG